MTKKIVALLIALAGATSVQASSNYTVTSLGTFGGASSYPDAVNQLGEVAGGALTSVGISHAFLYTGGTKYDIANGPARGMNDLGDVVGAQPGSTGYIAFHYHRSTGTVTSLGTLGGAESEAYEINNSGVVAGYSFNAANRRRAFLYTAGSMHDLGTLGGPQSFAYGINNLGQVVGYSSTVGDIIQMAVRFDTDSAGNVLSRTALFPGHARDINDSGQIAGTTGTVFGGEAVLYDQGTLIHLGTPPSGMSEARGINNLGQVVGFTREMNGSNPKAFLYSNGVRQDLNTLITGSGWQLQFAEAINDRGQIVAYGANSSVSQYYHAVLLTPIVVPEPSSIALTGCGGLIILGIAIRRSRGPLTAGNAAARPSVPAQERAAVSPRFSRPKRLVAMWPSEPMP